ncbi:hypothetical protein EDD17DRAFT_1604370 [Pisolithus thermaeus]|nr:hypothetical protein EV401DRAFT_1899050 [Pisolithus croceorrhizus]KAI6160292.1 hypothetical protein EDD17DRAFT_1604370 [Pisolithus thermaeus]
MSWPVEITRTFSTVESGADSPLVNKIKCHSSYKKLLNTLFPPESDFMVTPDPLPVNIDGGMDTILSFKVMFQDHHPVLILQVQPRQHLLFTSTREVADKQIRLRMIDLAERMPLLALHGISAIGTKLCFYKFEKVPPRITLNATSPDQEEQLRNRMLRYRGTAQR